MKISFLVTLIVLTQTISMWARNDISKASNFNKKAEGFIATQNIDSAIYYFGKASVIYQSSKDYQKYLDVRHNIIKLLISNASYDNAIKQALTTISYLKINERQISRIAPSHKAKLFNDLGICYHSKSTYDSALFFYQKSLTIKQKVYPENHLQLAESYKNVGLVMNQNGSYEKALFFLKNTLSIELQNLGTENPAIGDTFNDLGLVYSNIGNYNQAIMLYNQAIKIKLNSLGANHLSLATIYNNLGSAFFFLGRYEEALSNYELTLNIEKANYKNHPKTAVTLNNIGALYNKMGNNEEALVYFKDALSILKYFHQENHSDLAATYSNLGFVNQNLGAFENAMLNYKKALKIQQNIYPANHPEIAISYNKIAGLYSDKNEQKIALQFYRKALKIRQELYGNAHIDVATSFNNIGTVYNKLHHYDTALVFLNKALKIQKRVFGSKHPSIAVTFNNISNSYYSQKSYDKALGYLQKSVFINESFLTDKHPDKAHVYNNIGNIFRRMGKYNKALKFYQQALFFNTKTFADTLDLANNPNSDDIINRKILLRTLELKAKTLEELFQIKNNRNYLTSAIETFAFSDNLIEEIRKEYISQDDKIILGTIAKKIYEGAIKTMISKYRLTNDKSFLKKAFYYAEKSKSSALYSAMLDTQAKKFAGISDSLLYLENKLKSEIAYFKSKIITEKINNKNLDATVINQLNNQLFEKSNQYSLLINNFENNFPNYYRLKYEKKVQPVEIIQAYLAKENSTLIEYFVGDSAVHIFTLTQDSLYLTSKKRSPELLNNIELFVAGLINSNFDNYTKNAYLLYKDLIEPVTKYIKSENLVIIPDGPLWNVNFDALISEKSIKADYRRLHYLVNNYALSYTYSSTLLMFHDQQSNFDFKNNNLLGFAYQKTKEVSKEKVNKEEFPQLSLIDLPGSRKEIKMASQKFEGLFFNGPNASERNFKKNASHFPLIHLALHGEVNNQNPENSRLIFTQQKDSVEDNMLYAHEIYNISLNTNLIVLSACNTASGRLANGEGLISLGRAFMYAGCKSQLISQWQLTDTFTPDIMKTFYDALNSGKKKNKALQLAKLAHLQQADNFTANPIYWAPLIHVGDNSALILNHDLNMVLYIFGTLILIFAAFNFKKLLNKKKL